MKSGFAMANDIERSLDLIDPIPAPTEQRARIMTRLRDAEQRLVTQAVARARRDLRAAVVRELERGVK